ncbi:ArsA family ATPase [Tsukamurella sp. 8F]|uniref:ArsA family ATPase n=1 Tax=unclassified Tsukamurella TaxID=2633480 RepID=UPI0023B91C4E|nr:MULTISPECIES: ArsA family ATPase [unclassified Tsukamurella]MDF0532499.1 ArsA family ATPase [Tsukamurella sp. 8J]MDF0589170.1 ArsA family ATPase [Tsukamurella sp. 8F]
MNQLAMGPELADRGTRVVVCCGSGGVGKTTTAAAMAVWAAEQGRRVIVLTIDPARRLAQALGVADLSNEPQPVDVPGSGSLHAMMLDMKRTFDEMVTEHADPGRAEEILSNPFYQTIASSFSGTQEYMAMEKLGQLVADDRWDLVVVDTPPSRNALDFLDAPKRFGSILDSRLMRLIAAPTRGVGRVLSGGMGIALKVVSTIVGSQMLSDASIFVGQMDSLLGGFQERADRTYALLAQPSSRFVVVASPESDSLREASYFIQRLRAEDMPLVGLIVNRTHPSLADVPPEDAKRAAARLAQSIDDPVASAVLRVHAWRAETAAREVSVLSDFVRRTPHVRVVGVPSLPFEVASLEALQAVAEQIMGEPETGDTLRDG